MKAKNINTRELSEAAQEEIIFRMKADSYTPCFIETCAKREQCLRWLVGQYADARLLCLTSVNPRNAQLQAGDCQMYREKVRVVMKLGMTHFYENMTARQERTIRKALIATFNRKYYFQMRRGDRPIDPEAQATIAGICREYGWTGPLVYDGETVDYQW